MRGRVVENGIGQAEECERSPGRVEGMMNRQKPGEAEGERGETESGRAVALGTVGVMEQGGDQVRLGGALWAWLLLGRQWEILGVFEQMGQ